MNTQLFTDKFLLFAKSCFPVLIILAAVSCKNYYKITTAPKTATPDTLQSLAKNKILIIHFSDNTILQMQNPSVENNELKGKLLPLNTTQSKYAFPKSANRNVYHSINADEVLNEAHIYYNKPAPTTTEVATLPLAGVAKINTNSKNKGASTTSHVLGIGIPVVLVVALTFIIAIGVSLSAWKG